MTADSWQSRLGYMATRKMIEDMMDNGYFGESVDMLCSPSVSYPQLSLNLPAVSTSAPLEVVHCGVFESIKGPPTGSSFNSRFVVIFVDDYSRYVTLHTVFGHEDVLSCAENFVKEQNELPGRTVKLFSVDRNVEFDESFKGVVRFHGFTVKHNEAAVSVTEETNRFLWQIVGVLLESAKLDDSFWLFALEYGVFTFNRIVNKSTHVTPFERWSQTSFNYLPSPLHNRNLKPDYEQLYAFGAQIDQFGVLLGYREYGLTEACYRVYDFSTKKMSLIRSNENGFVFLKLESDVQFELVSSEYEENYSRTAPQQPQQQITQDDDKWHVRFGHIGHRLIDLMSRANGFGSFSPYDQPCGHCTTISDLRNNISEPVIATSPGELVHVYLCDTFVPSIIVRAQYVLILVDDYSRFVTVEYPKLNSDKQLYLSLNQYIEKQKDTAWPVTKFITCQDRELFGRKEAKKIKKRRVEFKFSKSDSKIAESTGRLLEVMTKIMLHQCGLDDYFWKYAMNTAVHVLNRVAHPDLLIDQQIVITPSMKFKSLPEPYSLSYLHVFGCECTFTSEETGNVEKGIFVGFDENRRNGRFPCLVWRDRSAESVVSGVLFRDLSFPAKENTNLVCYSWESIELKE